MPTLVLNGRSYTIRKLVLRRHDVAWLLGLSANEVTGLLRRGERLVQAGKSEDEIVAAGALPVVRSGSTRGVSPTALVMHPEVVASPLAQAALGAIIEGRLRAPRAPRADERPPALSSRLDLF